MNNLSKITSHGPKFKGDSHIHHHNPPFCFLIMRLNVKSALFIIITLALITTFMLYTSCQTAVIKINENLMSLSKKSSSSSSSRQNGEGDLKRIEKIDCNINQGQLHVDCHRHRNGNAPNENHAPLDSSSSSSSSAIYIPFDFIRQYFDIYGKSNDNDDRKFDIRHSYGKVYRPRGRYQSRGVFAYFENYNVEVRERVKCVSAQWGVPISMQWRVDGYFYPTQIAQFALAHWSKNLTEPEPHVRQLTTGDGKTNLVVQKMNRTFELPEAVREFVLTVDVLVTGASFCLTVILENRLLPLGRKYYLNYLPSDVTMTVDDDNSHNVSVYYGLGAVVNNNNNNNRVGWMTLTRDLVVDLNKAAAAVATSSGGGKNRKFTKKIPKQDLKIVEIRLFGEGAFDNLTLSTSAHMRQFYDGAHWFVRNQIPETGGWPNPVNRKIATGFRQLNSGWLSAMGQGHAMSVLARAYYHSGGDRRFLDVAVNALKPFRVLTTEGGILAHFPSIEDYWYEEYPTAPHSFVLNGFIFSLLGLYDLMTIAHVPEAEFLYRRGVATLRKLLPLFDMGGRTAYDLRHFFLEGGVAPNLARWDYHATHVNQLLILSSIEEEEEEEEFENVANARLMKKEEELAGKKPQQQQPKIFKIIAERWIGYMNGKKAQHN